LYQTTIFLRNCWGGLSMRMTKEKLPFIELIKIAAKEHFLATFSTFFCFNFLRIVECVLMEYEKLVLSDFCLNPETFWQFFIWLVTLFEKIKWLRIILMQLNIFFLNLQTTRKVIFALLTWQWHQMSYFRNRFRPYVLGSQPCRQSLVELFPFCRKLMVRNVQNFISQAKYDSDNFIPNYDQPGDRILSFYIPYTCSY